MDKYCLLCGRKFDAFTEREKYCMECAGNRANKRSKLKNTRAKTTRQLEKQLGTTLPCEPVEGWQELLLEDLANPFIDLTEIELCQKYGINVTDFYTYKVKMGLDVFAKELSLRSDKYRDQEGIYYRKMLVKQARTQPNATLLGLQMTGQYNRKLMDSDPLAGLSEDAKNVELEALLGKLRKPI